MIVLDVVGLIVHKQPLQTQWVQMRGLVEVIQEA